MMRRRAKEICRLEDRMQIAVQMRRSAKKICRLCDRMQTAVQMRRRAKEICRLCDRMVVAVQMRRRAAAAAAVGAVLGPLQAASPASWWAPLWAF